MKQSIDFIFHKLKHYNEFQNRVMRITIIQLNLKRIILFKIQKLKKEKKKAIYRIETIRIVQEIDNLEFCLNALVQDINNKNNR